MYLSNTIQYITSGLSLSAFVVAAILYTYRQKLKHRTDLIRASATKDRIAAIDATADFLRLDTSKLNTKQKEKIILFQLEARRQRDKMAFVFSLITAASLALLSGMSIILPALKSTSHIQIRNDRVSLSIPSESKTLKRSATFCVEPQNNGELVVGSGKLTDINIGGSPYQFSLNQIVTDTHTKICVEVVLYKENPDDSVSMHGVLIANEQY